MKLNTLSISTVVAALVGLANRYLLALFFGYIAAYSPLPRWLIQQGVEGIAFRAVLLPVDFLLNIALSLPAAALLHKLRPASPWLYLSVAVLPGFLWSALGWVGHPGFAIAPGTIVLGWLIEVASLPIAFWGLRRWVIPGAPNNSFKPKPLRGSA